MADLDRPRGAGSCDASKRVSSSWVLPAPLGAGQHVSMFADRQYGFDRYLSPVTSTR